MKKIGVFGSCDTAGVVATLRSIVPESTTVEPIIRPRDANPADSNKTEDEFFATLSKYDKIFVNLRGKHFLVNYDLPVIYYPPLIFGAFHPDLTYLKISGTSQPVVPHYNSAIIAWCYVNKIATREVPHFFSSRIFEQLGYFDKWDESVTYQRREFEQAGVEFDPYLLHVKRHLPFMHSTNHPKIIAITTAVKLAARAIGFQASLDAPNYAPDGLAGANWPIYAEIAEQYGIAGANTWSWGQQNLNLEDYVRRCYERYAELGVDDTTHFGGASKQHLNSVLGAAA